MIKLKEAFVSLLFAASAILPLLSAVASTKPETWFHIIGGNASREGLAADIAAVAEAGISGISLFHGGGDGTELWPGVTNGIPYMSANWVDLIKFAETECHKHGLKFKMQNCPGWSMSGGPWITPDRAMRKLVCFEPSKKPEFDEDDDYREIGEVEFPVEAEDPSVVRSLVLPAPSQLNHDWSFEPGVVFEVWSRGKKVIERECPVGTWSDTFGDPGLELTFDESFKDWKKVLDEHYARGVTHIVYNTFTHNPVIGGKLPSSSYGDAIGSPFLREQTWWPYLKHFSKYIERCGRELERGVPAVDILMYLGDDVNHKPSESSLLFGSRYKYDYLNNDVLMNALDVADGRLAIGACPGCEPQTDSPTYRVLWIPRGTFLLPATEAKIAAFAAKGARVVRGDFEPDWPSPVEAMLGIDPSRLRGWYQRRDGDENIFFVVEANGRSAFYRVKNGARTVLDPVTGAGHSLAAWRDMTKPNADAVGIDLKPVTDYPVRATRRIYEGTVKIDNAAAEVRLDLGKVRDWATVYVDGRKVADLWCEPYICDIASYVKPGLDAAIRVEVTSTWYNALVEDAKLPEKGRRTWTKFGPKPDAQYHEAGLIGPATICERGCGD